MLVAILHFPGSVLELLDVGEGFADENYGGDIGALLADRKDFRAGECQWMVVKDMVRSSVGDGVPEVTESELAASVGRLGLRIVELETVKDGVWLQFAGQTVRKWVGNDNLTAWRRDGTLDRNLKELESI